MNRGVRASAHPNLALVKYWGKKDTEKNLPATGSLGISLDSFVTETRVRAMEGSGGAASAEFDGIRSAAGLSWTISINGELQSGGNFPPFFHKLGELYAGPPMTLNVESSNNFPTAAGLASSASGFAALAGAASSALGLDLNPAELSSLARIGSGSATRSVFPGFVAYPEGASRAEQLFPAEHWPDLRCIIVRVSDGTKAVSSRKAMEASRSTSPYYGSWIEDSRKLYRRGIEALERRDIEALGPVMRNSYLRMFSTMFSAAEPLIYWQPESLRIIALAEDLRRKNIPVYETMDAGPQVKLITLAEFSDRILEELRHTGAHRELYVSSVGGGLEVIPEDHDGKS